MKKIIFMTAILFLVGCYKQSAIPLGNDMMEINVSAAPVYGRAGAQQMALEKAAQSTLTMGYDKFMVMDSNGWNETTLHAGSYGQINGNSQGFSGYSGSSLNTMRRPEAKLIIKMFHYNDAGADKAVDAKQVLSLNKQESGVNSSIFPDAQKVGRPGA